MKLFNASAQTDEYMNHAQLAYFEAKLRNLLRGLINVSASAKNELKETGLGVPDPYDVATAHAEIHIELEELRRHTSRIGMIEKALARIKDGSYGYCEMTGERIGLRRLEIQPFATLSVEAQETLERVERGMAGYRLAPTRTF
ncbi:MAG TPA: RNA polymerase-binding protein DksA [Desulfobulbaceae bacterium]|nr:RNA polymerase-binding protein DksA [Desulfobulbaceae bacterium]